MFLDITYRYISLWILKLILWKKPYFLPLWMGPNFGPKVCPRREVNETLVYRIACIQRSFQIRLWGCWVICQRFFFVWHATFMKPIFQKHVTQWNTHIYICYWFLYHAKNWLLQAYADSVAPYQPAYPWLSTQYDLRATLSTDGSILKKTCSECSGRSRATLSEDSFSHVTSLIYAAQFFFNNMSHRSKLSCSPVTLPWSILVYVGLTRVLLHTAFDVCHRPTV